MLAFQRRWWLSLVGIGTLFSLRNLMCATCVQIEQCASQHDNPTAASSPAQLHNSNDETSDPSTSSSPSTSLLEQFYDASDDGSLLRFARNQALSIYHGFDFNDTERIRISTPSLGHNEHTGETVVGFRIELWDHDPHGNLLMLCSLRSPIGLTQCQDSGITNRYMPPECEMKHWLAPEIRTFKGVLTTGPEDARLYFDEEGYLGASLGMRGCHPDVIYNATSPIFSVYTVRWKRLASPTLLQPDRFFWHRNGLPKLLHLLKNKGASWKDIYPEVTKNWIPIPPYPGPSDPMDFRISYGWTLGMGSHHVYRPMTLGPSLNSLVPIKRTYDYSAANDFRGSTNFVRHKGVLVALGHRKEDSYAHYWYAVCPTAPYGSISWTPEFQLTDEHAVSFALGLALAEDRAYVTWSINDLEPRISRYALDDVYHQLSMASRQNDAWRAGMSLADFCQPGGR